MFTVIDLGNLNGGGLVAINCHSQYIGWANTAGDSSAAVDSFFGDGERRVNLGHLNDELYTLARGLNRHGQVVGYTESFDKEDDAFIWQDGVMTMLPSLGGQHSAAYSINDIGQAVGFSYTGDAHYPYYSACLWQNGAVTELNPRNSINSCLGLSGGSIALAINNHGLSVGVSWLSEYALPSYACLWQDGQCINLSGSNQQLNSSACGINDMGQIIGWVGANRTQARSCVWYERKLHLIEKLSGSYSVPTGINTHGHIVGYAYLEPPHENKYQTYAYLWQEGHLIDLTHQIDDTNWTMETAYGINDLGQIIGSGKFGGERRAVLLVPHNAVA